MARPAALVDIDGTLVDSNYLHALGWWRALKRAGTEVPVARVHRLIGMGSDQLMQEVLGRDDEALSEDTAAAYRELRDEVTVFPGAADLLRALSERGLAVVLATSGRPDDVEMIRERLGADRWITDVVSSGEVDASKPAPDIFRLALERAGATPQSAVVVGDTGWDIDAATSCGLPCVAVTTGGWSRPELEAHHPAAVYDDVGRLLDELDRSPFAPLFGTAG